MPQLVQYFLHCACCIHHRACGLQGVRSVGIMDRILSSGTGRGRIAFFDLRANDYISVQQEALSRPQTPTAPIAPQTYPRDAVVWADSGSYDWDEYDAADFDDLDDEDDFDDDEDNDVDEDSDVADDHDVDDDHDVAVDNEASHNAEAESDDANPAIDGATPAIQDDWQLLFQPSGPPSFRRPMPGPTPLVFHPAQPHAHDFGLTAQSNLWLQTGNGWLDHNHVYM